MIWDVLITRYSRVKLLVRLMLPLTGLEIAENPFGFLPADSQVAVTRRSTHGYYSIASTRPSMV
jgi:hypothetical protein